MKQKDHAQEAMPAELSDQFKKAIREREIKMREREAELKEEAPGPICVPDEYGACESCSG